MYKSFPKSHAADRHFSINLFYLSYIMYMFSSKGTTFVTGVKIKAISERKLNYSSVMLNAGQTTLHVAWKP